jgi:hypothetical protein
MIPAAQRTGTLLAPRSALFAAARQHLTATLAAWYFAVTHPSAMGLAHLAAFPGASTAHAFAWMTTGAALAWACPALAGMLRGGVPIWALVLVYWALAALTVGAFAAATGAVHALARMLNEAAGSNPQGEYARLAFVCAAFAAPLTLLAGLLLAGPDILRLALLPLAGYGLVLSVLAVRAVYRLEWRWTLVAALPAAALLAGVPLAAVAGVWAGLA